MRKKAGRGRPFTYAEPQNTRTTTNLNNSSDNNYKSFSESIDSCGNGVDERRRKKNVSCRCSTCEILDRDEEIKSLQKSVSMIKRDTNEILDKVLKLGAVFSK